MHSRAVAWALLKTQELAWVAESKLSLGAALTDNVNKRAPVS